MKAEPAASLRSTERVTRSHVRRIAAALGLDPRVVDAMQSLPPGWHWAFCIAIHARAGLASDGLPADDPLLPSMEAFPTRVMGGTKIEVVQPIPLEAEMDCDSRIAGLVDKPGRSGPLRILTIERLYSIDAARAIRETQEVVYLTTAPRPRVESTPDASRQAPHGAHRIAVDEVDVFRFSAATFNSHRIHYDTAYAVQVEGWSALLVQAKLLALHVLQACTRAHGDGVRGFSFRSLAPLACPAQAHLEMSRVGDTVEAAVLTASGRHLAATVRYR